MRISCTRENLMKGINIVSKAVPSKTTMDILECILIDATTDCIKLIGNDMELGIETVIEGEIEETGMVAIDQKMLSEIIRRLPESDVLIETSKIEDGIQAHITCENSDFVISGRDGDEFSFLPYIEKENTILLSQMTLKDVIRQTIFSIAANENNKIMTGELFEVRGDRLRVASLDGHRISIRNIELGQSYPDRRVIVPGKTLMEISKILSGEANETVEISTSANHIVFEFGSTMVVSRLIEGDYFHIDQMISGDYDTRITVNKKDMIACIDRSLLFVKEGDKKPIVLDVRDEEIVISIRSPLGNMREEMASSKEGKDLLIGFNPKFIIDALRAVDDDEICMYMMNPKAPCYIKDERESYIYLILPVNFSGNH